MNWKIRTCSQCATRFEPRDEHARSCEACQSAGPGLARVQQYIRTHTDATLVRVAVATGVAEPEIRAWAAAGLLQIVPAGAEPCTCSPDSRVRCHGCRARVAEQLRSLLAPRPAGAPSRLGAMGTRHRS
jgi:hypothetical protein